MKYLAVLFLSSVLLSSLSGQSIVLDEEFGDWSSVEVLEDSGDNGNALGLESLSIINDQSYIYLKVEFDREINLQSENINLNIETQSFRLQYNFGDGEGRLFRSGIVSQVNHPDISLMTSPTVTSTVFELRLSRRWNIGSNVFNLEGSIDIDMRHGNNGDRIPNSGAIDYTFDEVLEFLPPAYNPEKINESDLRVCSYNVLRDQIFESESRSAYTRLLSHINADIYCFQEIYDHTSEQLLNRLFNVFGALEGTEWYHSKRGSDLIVLSRYPIIFAREISGNGVFVLEKDGQEIVLINIHLACCEQDRNREEEIDALLRFLREARLGNENYDLQEGTPIIITGDTNFVGNADQLEALTKGNIFNNDFYGEDFQPDWDNDGLADAKPLTANTNVSYTWFSDFSRFSPGRLDFIFYTDSQIERQNAFVLDTRALSTQQLNDNNLEFLDSNLASDHRPVIADFKFLTTSTTDPNNAQYAPPYPNPSRGVIRVHSDFNGVLQLINLSGQVVETSYTTELSTLGLASGVYLLKMKSKGKEVHHRVVIHP
jgi:mRNA deadenylase 3'-5' endonuclease subunit Ccr4